jgi:AcrR family transcriptional regulator
MKVFGVKMMKAKQEESKELRILKAAEQVFSRKGYEEATLDEIINIADTGKGTVYKYFGNKDFLFYTLIQSKNDVFLEKLKVSCSKELPFMDRLQGFLLELLKFIIKNKMFWRVLIVQAIAAPAGWCFVWDDKNKDIEVDVQWGSKPSPEEVAIKRKYYIILRSEITVLVDILEAGVAENIVKPIDDLPLVAMNIFFGCIVMISQTKRSHIDLDELATMMCDRIMNGHKK